MLIYSNCGRHFVFIHIPKNGGKYIRNKIISNKDNKIVKHGWFVVNGIDLAHIPYVKKHDFIANSVDYTYLTYTRCPYDRIISGFFYKNPKKTIGDFTYFIKNKLVNYDFSMNFESNIIHYYPQYLFVCDDTYRISDDIEIKKLEDEVAVPKQYNLLEYFDDECVDIINRIYNKDFVSFHYNILRSIRDFGNNFVRYNP